MLNVMVTPVALAFFPVPVMVMVEEVTAGAGAVVRATSPEVTKTILPSDCTTIEAVRRSPAIIAAPSCRSWCRGRRWG